jgi:uncharacterized protein with NAD-binding domain and iron-sulfur cluster
MEAGMVTLSSSGALIVDRWRMDGSFQPFLCLDVRLYGFAFSVDADALKETCARYFTRPTNNTIQVEPFLPMVVVTFAKLGKLKAENPPYRDVGWAEETEATFWIVLRPGQIFPMPRPVFFAPYIVVDLPLAMVQGREIYGFPKEYGWFDEPTPSEWIQNPADGPQANKFTLDVFGVPKFGADEKFEKRRLLEITRAPVDGAPAAPRWHDYDSAAAELQTIAFRGEPGLTTLGDAYRGIWPPVGSTMLLKQIPAATTSREACHQSVVEARIDALPTVGSLLRGTYRLSLNALDTHPLTRDLGLRHGTEATVAWWLDFNFRLRAGTSRWTHPPSTIFGAVSTSSDVQTTRDTRAGGERAAEISTASERPKPKVAILGGGVGAIAAAFALTDGENAGRYDVTIYQLGGRLGGKGASGRNLASDRHARIEEHGVHVWFGFYYNAVRMMRRCLTELERLTGERHTWDDYFTAHDSAVLEDYAEGEWMHAPVEFPPGHPGAPPTPWEFAVKMIEWLVAQMKDVPELVEDDLPGAGERRARTLATLDTLDRPVDVAGPQPLLAEAARACRALPSDARDHLALDRSFIVALLDACRRWARELLERSVGRDRLARWIWMAVDLGTAAVRGMLTDGVLTGGFDVIDDEDIWRWLEKHGASAVHRDCVFVRALYSQAFAFPGGDPNRRSIGAGTTLRATLRMLFAYEERFMWKMNAGMGDIVFAPFYRVLKKRNVKFRFFHRVRALHASTDSKEKCVDSIVLGRQLRMRGGDDDEYCPLVEIDDPRVGKRWCWRSEPDLKQIDEQQVAEIERLEHDPTAFVSFESYWSSWGPEHEDKVTLVRRKDFDHVVLGVSLGALGTICADLASTSLKWQRMLANIPTVRTQSFQLWLRPTVDELGWDTVSPVSTAYVEPIDTWAEMNQTRDAEPWPRELRPGLIAYFCGVMPDSAEPPWFGDPGFPRGRRADVYRNMEHFLSHYVRHLFPKGTSATDPDVLDWKLLIDPANGTGAERLRAQFWIANIDPTERYVLSVPGSSAHRLRSDESGFENLYLAGDWTRNAINAGCVEAALTSGMRAARGLSGFPRDILGESDL